MKIGPSSTLLTVIRLERARKEEFEMSKGLRIRVNVRGSKETVSTILENIEKIVPFTASDEEVYNEGFNEVDPNGMYIRVYYTDGSCGTFRASFVDFEAV